MGKIAFVFSGQGAQFSGMGKDLYEKNATFRNVFDIAETVKPGISEICFESSLEKLSETTNTQPCMFVFETAVAKLLEENGITPGCSAGFSLGEAAALSQAGAFEVKDGLEYLSVRAAAMDYAAKENPGKMAAILKLDGETVDDVCAGYGDVWAVNYNCPGQTVVSGSSKSVDAVAVECGQKGGKAIVLNVSGAFHSPYMESASKKVSEYLKDFKTGKLKHPVFSNATGGVIEEAKLKTLMAKQISSPVLWSKSIEAMILDGADTFIEIGPGKVLCGLIRKINPDVDTMNVQDVKSFERALEILKNIK